MDTLKQQTIMTIDSQSITDVTTMHVETVVLDETVTDTTSDFKHGFKLFYDTSWELLYGYYWHQELTPDKTKKYYKEMYLSPGELGTVIEWLTREEQTSQVVREYQIKFPKNPKKGIMIDL